MKSVKHLWLRVLLFSTIALALLVFSLHLLHFNVLHFKGLNSDNALHILMSERLSLPYGLYYWGQNRLGSIIPIIGHLFYLLGFKALVATAISQSLLLVLAAYFFSRFFTSPVFKLAVLTIVLLPIYPFFAQVEIGHPVIGQLFFSSLLLYFYYCKFSVNRIYQFWFGLSAALALWASELSVALLLAMLMVENIQLFKKLKASPIFAPLGFALGVLFILVAKNNVAKVEGYHELFTGFSDALNSMLNHFSELLKMMAFETNKPFNSILLYGIIAVVLLCIGLGAKHKIKPSRLTLLFLLTGLITFFSVHFSHWNALMGRPLHHFTPAYFFFIISLLSYAQQLQREKLFISYLSLIPAGAQAFASIAFITTFNLGVRDRINRSDARALVEKVKVEHQISEFTIIGNYWNTYIIDALSEEVVAVPYQGGHIRNDRYLDEAIANEEYIFIKNGWLEEFPDTTRQWDQTLIRASEPDTMHRTVYALYRKQE